MSMAAEDLSRYGWNDTWASRLGIFCRESKLEPDDANPEPEPGRVVRHHGVTITVATARGTRSVPLRRGLAVAPVIGDWVVVGEDAILGVLPRSTVLERRAGRGHGAHALAANIDQVLIVCGLDRPLNPGRIERCATVTWEAGATPSIVLTKADLWPTKRARKAGDERSLEAVADDLSAAHAGLDVLTTSSVTMAGMDALQTHVGADTVTLLGESGAGKSSLVNALAGKDIAGTGDVRSSDRKGRHTTTSRELYLLPTGGVVIDTPGLRSIGLWGDADSVVATFDDIAELAEGCRFRDCAHNREPGCAVQAAVAEGRLDARRLEAFHALAAESAERQRW